MVLLVPASAAGSEFTVIVTVPVFLQPVAVIISVKVYVVVTEGLAVGLLRLVELSPDDGLHE